MAPALPVDETITVPAQPASVSAVRRFTRSLLVRAEVGDELVDDAALVATELVANAVLHAGGPVSVRIVLDCDPQTRVRVEVVDDSPVAPTLLDYGTGAATGRGLALVARLSERWGVERAPGGKAVWAELVEGMSDNPGEREPVSTLPASTRVRLDGSVPVEFLGIPVGAYLRLQEQNDGILRELELLAFTADHAGVVDPTPELVDVIERSRGFFNTSREGFRIEVLEAAEHGHASVDLHREVHESMLGSAAELVELFERAEELADEGELLIRPADPDVRRLRRWFVGEMYAQVRESRPPQPFEPQSE